MKKRDCKLLPTYKWAQIRVPGSSCISKESPFNGKENGSCFVCIVCTIQELQPFFTTNNLQHNIVRRWSFKSGLVSPYMYGTGP